jgi:hypothetical protein
MFSRDYRLLTLRVYRRQMSDGKRTSRNIWTVNFDRHHYYPPSPRKVLTFQGSLLGFNFSGRIGALV